MQVASSGDVEMSSGNLTVPEISLLGLGESPTIFDIGANDGSTSKEFRRQFPKARIVAFEPDPRAARRARRNLAGLDVHFLEAAIAAEDGVAEFVQSGGKPTSASRTDLEWDLSGSLREPNTHLDRWPWVEFPSRISVETRSLDSVCRELGIRVIDFIWMDVQGAEDLVLDGAVETLTRCRYLYTEWSDEQWYAGQVCLGDLSLRLGLDWEIKHLYPMDVLFVNTSNVVGDSS